MDSGIIMLSQNTPFWYDGPHVTIQHQKIFWFQTREQGKAERRGSLIVSMFVGAVTQVYIMAILSQKGLSDSPTRCDSV